MPLYNAEGEPEWYDTRRLPEVLTGPEYTISTIDRLHVLRRNTICGDLLREDCEERLIDAKYIFRVTGSLSKWDTRNNSFWHFCGRHGSIMEELEFKLVKGKCIPGAKITATEKCYGVPMKAMFSVVLTLSGVSSDALTEHDTSLLETAISDSLSTVLMNIELNVKLQSWFMSESGLLLTFDVQFDPSAHGVSAVQYDDMETLSSEMLSAMSTSSSMGTLLKLVQSSLSKSTFGGVDVLSSATAATITSIQYLDSVVIMNPTQSKVKVVSNAVGLIEAAVVGGDVDSKATLLAFQHTMVLIGVLLSSIGVVGFVFMRLVYYLTYRDLEQIPADSNSGTVFTDVDSSMRELNIDWN